LKLDAPGLVHKTEVGAVRLGLGNATEVEQAFDAGQRRMKGHGFELRGGIVMQTIAPAPEILVGATQDPLFGPLVACGAGGIYTEVLKDVQFRLAPLSAAGAERMVKRLRIAPLLSGARGGMPSDIGSIADTLVRLGQLAVDFPRIQEIEANPIRALPAGAVAVDARVRVSLARVA